MKATFFLQRIMASNSLIWGYTSWLFNRTPRRFLKITLLLMALLFCGNVGAQEIICASVDFSTKAASCSSYTDIWNYDGWKIYGAANNNAGWGYVRVGGKKSASVKTSSFKSPIIDKEISFIKLTALNTASGSGFTMNDVKLIVASDAEFANIIDEVLNTEVATSMTFVPSGGVCWPINSYFKLEFNWSSTSSNNRGMDVTKIELFATNISSLATPSFSIPTGRYVESQNVEVTCSTEDVSIYYTLDGTDPSIESALYTGAINVAFTTTLKAVAIKDGVSSAIATATYTILTATPLTIAEFLAEEESADVYYELTGTVSNIVNTTYGNFDLTDETGTIYVYGLTSTFQISNDKSFASLNLVEGDLITIRGTRASYSGVAQMGGPAYFLNKIELPMLEVPVVNAASEITATGFTANWEAVTNATSYVVNVWIETGNYAKDLIISEYVEGSSNNKYIEIYNGTGSSIDLSDYKLQMYTNGSSTPSNNIQLNGTLEHNACKVYKNSAANKYNGNAESNSAVNFNGDDAIALYKISTESYVDIFGVIGTDPGTAWTCEQHSTLDKTLRRKSTVREGISTNPIDFTTLCTEWDISNIDDVSNLGQHNMETKSNAPIPGSPFTVSSGTSLNVTGLSFDTKYCYNVVAKADGYVDSDVSNTICTTTSNTSCALATPVVTATPTTSTIYLQWSPIDGATSYIVSLNAETPQTVTGTSYTFTSLTPSTSYNWSVAASSDECTGIAATGTTETLEQPTVAGVEIVEVDTNGLKLDFHEQDAIASVVIDNEVTVSEGERPIADDIFFSKYFEAASTAKLLAIYNGTKDKISLTDLEIRHRDDAENALQLAGFGATEPNYIMPNEEIIIYNKAIDTKENQPIDAINSCAEQQENFEEWKPSNERADHEVLKFSGKGTITLLRNNSVIDIIGAFDDESRTTVKEGNTLTLWAGDENDSEMGFYCSGGDNIKTEEIEDDYGLSTNLCLLVRRNHVKSGAEAVEKNIGDFYTLCDEWGGFHIEGNTSTARYPTTCEGFGYVGGFDYQGYYTQYVQLQTTEFDDLTPNADGTYTLPIPSLHKYSCTNIKLKTLDANGEVLETITYKVPIIVNQDVTTASEAFFYYEGDTCKNCDVVIRDEATLTAEATGKSEFRNVEVYPQATLAVPESESLTVHSLRMRSNAVEDQMPYANIVGTLNNQTNMLYYDMRINNSAYRFFALPDTIKVGSIKFSNGMPAVSGTDFLVMYYDGEQRTTNGGLQSNWKPLFADSSIWAGNGYNIATAKAKMQELRFELEYDKVMGPDTKQVHVYDYGMNDYREDAITPNNVGWNLVGNPYLYIYEDGEGKGLVYGKLEISDDGYIWNDTENVRYITYFNDKGRTYLQDKVNRTLRPFKCFFVQVGDPENEEKGLMYVTFNKFKAHNPDRQMVLAQRTPEPSEEQYVAVQLALGDKTDKMGITIDNAYTTEYEIGRDLEKMMNYGTLPHVYAYVNNSQKLAFNAVPEWAAQSVVAGAYFPEAGEYTISLDPNDRPTNRVMAVWLTDMINNVTTNLLLGDYSFYAQRAEQKNRFMIAVELAPEISTSTLVSSADGVYAYTQQRQMTICGLVENSVVSVYDALGHLVIQRNTSDVSLTEQLPAAGMYLVKVVNAQQKATLKLLAY